MATDKIRIKGAREHNLKNVDVTIPRDQLVVFTGLSGSGKSSLAFDTIYADGQERNNPPPHCNGDFRHGTGWEYNGDAVLYGSNCT